ncbi:hypothetical protein SAMN02927921_00826 [Sinomicrobium oceani]|uniref:Uncharacterized protein n=1 Tax=Sinomicrobium oceani TaxID=1150368 RepID=A0A1K1MTR6_9FLAO|nr:hypothetical protein SAMN02927921_00826 [Sinomicrobium oceani]
MEEAVSVAIFRTEYMVIMYYLCHGYHQDIRDLRNISRLPVKFERTGNEIFFSNGFGKVKTLCIFAPHFCEGISCIMN